MTELTPTDQARLVELARVYPQQRQVTAAQAGLPLLELLQELYAISAALAEALIDHGGVWVGRQRVRDQQAQLAAAALIDLHTPPQGQYYRSTISAAQIIYEDAVLLALNKAAGDVCAATPWDVYGTVEVALREFLHARDGAAPPLHLIHRLDRDTSGVLLISKDPAINGPMQRLFNRGSVRKRYQAWCTGAPEWSQIMLRTGHSRGINGLWTLYPAELIGQPHGPNARIVREARTSFSVLERHQQASRIEAELHTGRTHQIRLHLTQLGHPLLGDERYGGPQQLGPLALPQQLLHAAQLECPHPLTQQPLALHAPLPTLWQTVSAYLSSHD